MGLENDSFSFFSIRGYILSHTFFVLWRCEYMPFVIVTEILIKRTVISL